MHFRSVRFRLYVPLCVLSRMCCPGVGVYGSVVGGGCSCFQEDEKEGTGTEEAGGWEEGWDGGCGLILVSPCAFCLGAIDPRSTILDKNIPG